jgi:hypothetical protein
MLRKGGTPDSEPQEDTPDQQSAAGAEHPGQRAAGNRPSRGPSAALADSQTGEVGR